MRAHTQGSSTSRGATRQLCMQADRPADRLTDRTHVHAYMACATVEVEA